MNIERLQTLANHLKTIVCEEFDLSYWYKENDCGSVACAVGHGCNIPEFQNLGLRMAFDPTQTSVYFRYVPRFEDKKGFNAIEAFFEISDDMAEWLFDASYYLVDHASEVTPAMVVDRIQEVIAASPGVPEAFTKAFGLDDDDDGGGDNYDCDFDLFESEEDNE